MQKEPTAGLGSLIGKIVTGGQTGADRAALDMALKKGMVVGGWCPAGRLAEDGVIASVYPLIETPSSVHAQRTAWNVRDSDGTLVLCFEEAKGGTHLTIVEAKKRRKPLYIMRLPSESGGEEVLEEEVLEEEVLEWVTDQQIDCLNLAGPSESESPGVYQAVLYFLERIW